MRADDNENVLDACLTQGGDDVFQDGRSPSGSASLGRPMRVLLPAAGMSGEGHARPSLHAEPLHAAGRGVVPRLRQAISSATMLTAISGTVCEPMSKPSGAWTRASASCAHALGEQVLEDQLDLPLAADHADVAGRASGPGGRAPPRRGCGRG